MENFCLWSLKNSPQIVVLMKKLYILRQSTDQHLTTNINYRPQDSTSLYLSTSLILRKPHNLEEVLVDGRLGIQSSKSGKINSQNLDGKGGIVRPRTSYPMLSYIYYSLMCSIHYETKLNFAENILTRLSKTSDE